MTRLTAFERTKPWLACAAVLLAGAQIARAQSVFGGNLIVNGDAESGATGTATKLVASIPGWTTTGKANVLPYDLTGFVLLSDPAPPDHGFQYFENTYSSVSGVTSTLTQMIDVSSGATTISGGSVRYTVSAYLGSSTTNVSLPQFAVAFQNASGQTFSGVTLGPAGAELGMSLQQQIGIVPPGTTLITVTLTLTVGGAADSLSVVLTPLVTVPSSVLGKNLVVNGNAEAGPGAPHTLTTLYVPGWSTTSRVSVAPYGGTGWIGITNPGPADRGVNLFCGQNSTVSSGSSYQDIDVSAAGTLIDSGQVNYQLSVWLGGLTTSKSPTLTYTFFDWSGNQLAPTAELGPTAHSGIELVETSHSATLPALTRRVHIAMSFPYVGSLADDISFILSAPGAPPVIGPGGVVSASAFGGFTAIAPGSWIEIYGSNLAPSIQGWTATDFDHGVAPTTLNGVKVSVGGTDGFIDYVSPGQIDALVPSNAPIGVSELIITNANGTSEGFGLVVNATQPGLLAPASFIINGKQYLGAVLPDNQTFAIPTGAIAGVASRPAKVGEVLTIYGVGFGPVSGGFTAGTLVTEQNSLLAPIQFLFGSTPALATYSGLAPSLTGLYQFDVVVPNVESNNAESITMTLGGMTGSQKLVVAVQN